MYVDYALTQPVSIFSTSIVMTEQHKMTSADVSLHNESYTMTSAH
jgi:hypothetical protein